MRNKYYFSLFMCFFAWMMFNGVTSSSGKSGKSGAPGENTCIQCHGGNTLNDPAGSITMSVAGVTNGQYTAGQTYQVSVTVSKMGQSLFGFSVSALNQAGQNAGSLVAGTDSHAEVSTDSGTSRNYITHNYNGGLSNNQKTFTFSWTAPASGNVNFYFTGLAANNNGINTGDYVYSSSMSLTQSTVAQTRIIAGEYFWGTIDPGSGTGTAFTATDGNFSDVVESIIASAQTVPNLSSPILLNIRVKDVNNNWGPRFKKVIFLTSTTPAAYNVAVTQGEFFFGAADPGQGNGTPLVVFDGNWGEAVEAATSLNTSWSLTAGMHLFNVRAKDGTNKWGPLFKKTISVQGTPANVRICKIQSAEFFFGSTDPGQGNGTNLLVLDDNWSDAIETAVSINTTWNLTNGLTLFNVRVKDETNQWGPLFKKTLSVQGPPTFRNLAIQSAEFFFGTFDPGAGAGTAILAFDGDYNSAIEQAFADDYAWSVTGNSALFNIRFKDEANKWGPLFKKTIFKNETPTARALNITFAEYYFGVFDPGAGNGAIIVAFDGNFDSAVETLLRNHLTWENQSGSTLFNIRVKDETNKWGPVFKRTIFFNGANPAVNLITEGETISRCPTFPVTLTYAGPQGFNVTWENGTVGNTVTFVPDGSGYFTMTAQLGNEYLFDSIYVNVYELPPAVVNPTGEILVCQSSTVYLNVNTASNYSYQWYFNDSVIPGSTQPTILPTEVGAYKVLVTNNTTTCQQMSLPTTFYLTAPIFPSGTVSTACNPNGVTLTAPVSPSNTYQWKKNGTNISGATNSTYVATTPGNYQVTVNSGACVSTSPVTNVTSTGTTVVSQISPTGTQNICDGQTLTLNATTGTGYTYQWNKDGVAIVGANATSYLVSIPGVYTCTVSSNGCSLTSNATTVNAGSPVTPSVAISSNVTTVCSGTAVIFTATPTNGGTAPMYQWKKNDVSINGATSATYSLSAPVNNDVITVVMISNNACQSTNTSTSNAVTLVVNNTVTPTVSITAGSNNVCSGTSVQFTSSITNGGTTPAYQWKKNGVNITGATAATYSSDALVNGDVITLSLTSNAACASTTTVSSNSVTMVINAAVTPSVSIAANNTTVCSGTAVSFTATPTNGGTTPTYQWKKNGVNITGATSATYSLTTPANNDAISLVMTSNAACTSTTVATSNTVNVTVTSSLTPAVSIAADATTVCSGTAVNFTATPTNGGTTPTYQWKKNGVNITGATSATYALASPANGDVLTVVMTSNSGCVSTPTATSNAVTLVVNNAVTPTVSITAGLNNVCSGTSVQFTSAITNGGTTPAYQWKKNGVNITGATAATYSSDALVNGDVIALSLTSNAACASTTTVSSNSVTMVINAAVTPSVSIAANATTVCSGTSVSFTASPTNGGTTPTYQWKKNGVNITGATAATYSLTTPANNDVITVVMTSNNACQSTNTSTSNAVTMNVNPNVTYYADTDNDGYGNILSSQVNCVAIAGYVLTNTDCNDGNALINPAITEVCGNDLDDNCSGIIDEGCAVLGCTDESACNYNPQSNTNDQSCIYPELYYNCQGNCLNDSDNDGICNELEVSGCTDETACNYDVLATDNTGCNYAEEGYDCEGNCLADTDSDGVCDGFEVVGCMDQSACNYDASATDQGTCIYPEQDYDCNGQCLLDDDGDGICNAFEIQGCTNPNACNFNDAATDDDGSCIAPQTEICNQLDDDCDGVVDNGVQYFDYYLDNDGDGFGDAFMENTCSAVTNPSWVLEFGDCQDNNANVYPTQLESCNSEDDNCNGQIDEGVAPGSIQAVSAITNAYPTCSGNGLKSANFAVGADSPITEGTATDLWYSFTAQHTSFRAGLSAAYGDNAIELYVQQGNCIVMIDSEHEVTTGNQILYNDELSIGTTYYVACRHFSGANNPSAKICFNHFIGSACDHYYSNNTGVYTSVCTAFKAAYRANAAQYVFGVESALQNGQPMVITPWSYTTTSSNSVVSRLGMILPVNNTGTPIAYGMKVGVVYAMTDAAGNSESVVAPGTTSCQTTLNSEATISLRAADRCPAYKAISSSISVDRTVCGAQRYQWEFTQVLPTAGSSVTVLGGLYSAVLFLNNVPGIANGRTYNVRVRAQHSSGLFGEWGSTQCLRTSGTGMALLEADSPMQSLEVLSENGFAIYPNPALNGQFSLIWKTASERMLNLKVWDMAGKLVAEQTETMEGQIWESKPMDLSNGIYIVEVNGQRQRWVIAQ
jgi:hypothetical protein